MILTIQFSDAFAIQVISDLERADFVQSNAVWMLVEELRDAIRDEADHTRTREPR